MKSGKYNGRRGQNILSGVDYLDAYLSLYSKEAMRENWKERVESFIFITTFVFGALFIIKMAVEIFSYLANN